MKKIYAVIAAFLFLSGGVIASNIITTDHNHDDDSVVSHSGGTDAYGCHNDRKRGGYHCH